MAKERIRQRIKRDKCEAARQRLERQREFDEAQTRDREEWDREMTELRERARAALAVETREEQFERQQEHQRRLASARVRERLLLLYTLCVAGAVTTALVGGAMVVLRVRHARPEVAGSRRPRARLVGMDPVRGAGIVIQERPVAQLRA